MDIQIDPHTLKRAAERGANEKEIRDVIETVLKFLPNMAEEGRRRYIGSIRDAKANVMPRKG